MGIITDFFEKMKGTEMKGTEMKEMTTEERADMARKTIQFLNANNTIEADQAKVLLLALQALLPASVIKIKGMGIFL